MMAITLKNLLKKDLNKYKSGAISKTRVGKHNVGTRAGNWIIFGQDQ